MTEQLKLPLQFRFEDAYIDDRFYIHLNRARNNPTKHEASFSGGCWFDPSKSPHFNRDVPFDSTHMITGQPSVDLSKFVSIKIDPDVIHLPDVRKGDWIQTYTGRVFYPLDPRPEEIFIKDIAWGLSRQCRYAGHTICHYSVAEHSVVVSRNVSRDKALAALLHDASEAYAVDIPRPMKKFMPEYKQIEIKIEKAVAERFGLTFPWDDEIMEVDGAMIQYERAAFMSEMKRSDMDWTYPNTRKLNNVKLRGLEALDAFNLFMDRYRELTEG